MKDEQEQEPARTNSLLLDPFLVALAFLTVLPIRLPSLPSGEVVGRSRLWYPVVGALFGAALGGWTGLLVQGGLSPALGAFLVVLAWVGASGALHLDGFCDLCDGLFGGRSPEDRLRILKDPHLGTFGLTGGVLLLLGKWVLVQEALVRWQLQAAWLVGGAAAAARCLALCVAAGAKYPRPQGTGKLLVEATRGWEGVLFAVLAALFSGLTTPLGYLALAPFVSALVGVLLLRRLCRSRLGGITGDCLGAGIETAEFLLLLATAVLAPLVAPAVGP